MALANRSVKLYFVWLSANLLPYVDQKQLKGFIQQIVWIICVENYEICYERTERKPNSVTVAKLFVLGSLLIPLWVNVTKIFYTSLIVSVMEW